MPDKRLDQKLARIRSGQYTAKDFIIADAKDADMGFGMMAPGEDAAGVLRTKADYLSAMQDMTSTELVDIMLMSTSSAESLLQQSVFTESDVTPAVRLNDTTDIWCARGSSYRESASRPFATADIEQARELVDLGLYSMTFSNDIDRDLNSLQSYGQFRGAARAAGMRHFLEVFNPAFDIGIPDDQLGYYINDMIGKALAGITRVDAPQFLKIQFNGARAMEELSRYDPNNLITGILGGSKGTTRDTFELVHQAEQAGARVALFGRKINLSEAPLTLVGLMREVIEQRLSPADAVSAYHEHLRANNITAQRSPKDDAQVTEPALIN